MSEPETVNHSTDFINSNQVAGCKSANQ